MIYRCLIWFCLCLLGVSGIAQANQEISFTSLTTKDGLSANAVNAILKDHYGLMWFATEDGLNKFDGTNFSVYRHIRDNPSSLMENEILSLHEDREGNLWVGTGGGSLSLYDRKKDAFVHFLSNIGANAPGNNVIRSICSDYRGNVWIAHYAGVNIIDPVTKKVTYFRPPSHSDFRNASNCLYEDSQHNMWIGTYEGIFLYNPSNHTLNQFSHIENQAGSLSGNIIYTITEDKYGNVWIGTNGGLSMLQPGSNNFTNYRREDAVNAGLYRNAVSALAIDSSNQLWIGTNNGLEILNIRTGVVTYCKSDSRNIRSLNDNSIVSLYIDKQGIYWVGSYRGGINKYDKNLNLFNLIQGDPLDAQGLHAKVASAFAEKDDGQIYVGTEGGGISLFNPKTRAIRHVTLQSKKKIGDNTLSVTSMKMTSNKQLLVGTYADGVFILNPVTESYQQMLQANNPGSLNSNDIFCITEDHLGNRWVGTNGAGINVLNPENKVIQRFTPVPQFANDIKLPINGYVRDIVEDRSGNIWIATHGGGIAMYNSSTRKFSVYSTNNSNLPSDKVQSLLEDGIGNMWAGTLGEGLCLLNRQTGRFQIFSEKEGLQNSNIRKIVTAKNGTIWVSTNKNLSSIDLYTKKINNYSGNNGVQYNNFVHGAGMCASDGNLYFGGLEGFNYFNPDNLKKNTNVPSVLITDLKVSNQSVSPSADGPITENISVAKDIHLDYKQNFSLSFVGLNYTAPGQNQYAYKLEEFDKDWNYIGSATTAFYTNIDPGEYTFRVIASNNDGIWNKEGASVKIFVHPPFWRTGFAYVLYLLAFGCLLLYIRYRGIRKLKRQFAAEQLKTRLELERKEAERIHELDQQKIKFLTNLSHEFRTPISLIVGPAETLLAQGGNERLNGQLQLIKRNGKRLLNLVNQLLDFRKMEEHELKLQESEGEFVSFVQEVTDSFKDLSEKKKISFVFSSSFDKLYTRFDHDKVERILFNLLSNAFKFTLNGGTVSLEMSKDLHQPHQDMTWVILELSDNGIGIPADQQEKIFDRFFQHSTAGAILNQGTGIGLSITREFVEMQRGTIEVQSESNKGTVFTVRLPLVELPAPAHEHLPVSEDRVTEFSGFENETEVSTRDLTEVNRNELLSILLVEDNEDFRYYLKENLQQQYKVYEASNGKEGWQKALAQHPQLIVSDVSMPYMDGIELCKKIKADKRTCHIPVILLTALTAEQDQLKGLQIGANDYITKPFNFEVLNAKLKNLLQLNNTLKSTYTKQIRMVASEVKLESEDEKLMVKIMSYLEENLDNTRLSVEDMSRHVGMSRTSLYNKLLELTGQTPIEFIRSVKLEKAAVLLEKSDMTIAQIAYSVGFSTPNYFAKSFKTKFNMLPSEYVQKKKVENKNTAAEATDDSA